MIHSLTEDLSIAREHLLILGFDDVGVSPILGHIPVIGTNRYDTLVIAVALLNRPLEVTVVYGYCPLDVLMDRLGDLVDTFPTDILEEVPGDLRQFEVSHRLAHFA